ncbi:MAG TPA: MFS transporter [Chlamydiales bacterium]|nr:MFS transporter [Chlamydiales bacterium]
MSDSVVKHVKMGRALFWTSCLSEPLFTLYGLVAFILYKDLGASAFQIAILTCLKPLITILSFYWSSGIGGKLKKNVVWAGILMRAPFLFCPWVDSAWFLIAAAVNYMFFFRAAIPGWMEMVRKNVREESRGRLFSLSSAIGYVEGIVLSLGLGTLLDRDPTLWKILFFAAALLGFIVVAIQARIPVDEVEASQEKLSIKEILLRPWKDSYQLMRERPDFARYQWGFMLYGFGIMLIQPALPIFTVDELGLTYTELTAGISMAKGMGYALSSPLWSKGIGKMPFARLASWVFVTIGLFPVLLTCSLWGVGWFYLAYFWYGVGQGGSHLISHMAGPIFAAKEESSRYTGVGVALGGIRGAIAPPLGGYLSLIFGPIEVLLLGGFFCFYSGISLLRSRFAYSKEGHF